MALSYEELKKMTAAQLREIASGIDHDAVHGYTTMHKEHLVKGICEALEIDMHVHHEVVGLNKTSIKSQIKSLKKQRDEALSKQDYTELKRLRHKVKTLKNKLKKATV